MRCTVASNINVVSPGEVIFGHTKNRRENASNAETHDLLDDFPSDGCPILNIRLRLMNGTFIWVSILNISTRQK